MNLSNHFICHFANSSNGLGTLFLTPGSTNVTSVLLDLQRWLNAVLETSKMRKTGQTSFFQSSHPLTFH